MTTTIFTGAVDLTPAQRGIWLAEARLRDATAYMVSERTRVTGRLDVPAWKAAADRVLAGEPTLRMRLERRHDDTGDAFPRVRFDAVPMHCEVVDLRGDPDPTAAADAWVGAALRVPVDPEVGVVSHAALLRVTDTEAHWFLRVHHVAADGYAFALVNRELARHYADIVGGVSAPDAGPADGPGNDAVAAQLRVLDEQSAYPASGQAVVDRAYWATQVPSAPPVPLAVNGASIRVERRPVPVDVRHADQVVLIAALALLTGAVTGQDEAVVGVHVMNRRSRDQLRTPCTAQSLVPLRIDLDPAQTLAELLDGTRAVWSGARDHQGYRHEDLRIDRGLAPDEPLCSVALNVVPFAQSVRFGEAVGRAEPVWDGPADGLVLDVRAGGHGDDRLVLEAPEQSLAGPTFDSYGHMLGRLVSQLASAADPDRPDHSRWFRTSVGALDFVGDADPGLRDGEASCTASAASSRDILGDDPVWVSRAFDRFPGDPSDPALTAPDATLTRAEAASAVHRLARLLRARDIGAGDRVVLHLPRCSWMLLAPAAVAEAGATWVPCDAEWPVSRVRSVIDTARPVLRVTAGTVGTGNGEQHGAEGPDLPEVPVVDLADADILTELRGYLGTPLTDAGRRRPVEGDDIAYVLFTSGSTGTPKGVEVAHRQLANFARTLLELYLPQELDAACLDHGDVLRVIHEHSPAFDSGMSPFVTFLAGHHVLVPGQEQLRIPEQHRDYILLHRPDVMDISPAVLEELLHLGLEPGSGRPQHSRGLLTSILIGGDACSGTLWHTLRELADRGVFTANAYGPTENTVDSTIAWVRDHDTPSIGRALPRQRAEVCDALGRRLPVGITGELFVSGASVTCGYLDRPDLTAEKFVDLPDGRRAYRTGDLVRREPDGSLTFIGRADAQLSLRGVRIESAEVETALLTLPGVRQAVAVVRDDGAGARLVAYLVGDSDVPLPGEDAAATARALASLRAQLPSASVPTAFVALDELPVTDRGKVDRRALPAPDIGYGHGAGWDGLTDTQRIVARVFAELLELDPTDLHADSDLFDLGGHSLTAARVVGRLGESGHSGAALRDIFRDPTVAGVAELIHGTGRPAGQPAGRTTGSGATGTPVLTDAQRRIWFIEQAEGPSALYAIPVVLQVAGSLDLDAFHAALVDTVSAYPALHHSYPDAGGGDPLPTPWTVEDLREALTLRRPDLDPADPDLGARIDSTIDLASELPVRPFVVGDRNRQAVVLVLHHLAVDGASLVPLLDTLSAAYQARIDHRTPEPPAPTNIGVPGEVTGGDIRWWTHRLADLPDVIDLPLDRPRPAIRDRRGAAVHRTLDRDLSERLRHGAAAIGATPFMVVQAVLAGLLTRCGAGTDIPVGTITSGRDTAAEDRIVSFLANTVVTRTDTSGDPTFTELVDRVREDTLELLDHGRVPFDAVVAALNPRRSPQHHPLFQVMLVAQNTDAARFDTGPGGPGVTTQVQGTGTAKFDLTCEFDVGEPGTGVHFRWEYAEDIFDRAGVENLASWFGNLLARALTEPDSRLWDRPLVDGLVADAEAETARMVAYRTAHPATPGAETLAAAVDSALLRHGDATAVTDVADDGSRTGYSYADLERSSAAVRDALTRRGIGPGDLVALLVPRSAAQVSAVLGVVRSGAAYVPLDPENPVARLVGIIEDARPVALVAGGGPVPEEVAAALDTTPLISLDSLPESPVAGGGVPATSGVRKPAPDDPAYVIFTSGSTGRPKGVVIPQVNVIRLLESTWQWFGFSSDDVWTLFHSYAFDFAVWEMYGALLHGGRLVVVPPSVRRSPAEFLTLLGDEGVTVLNQTPSAFGQLVRADAAAETGTGTLPALRTIVLGGEAMDPDTVRTWFRRHSPGAPEVVNMYGITETTVHVTYQRLSPDMVGSSPVGEPIPDLSLHLLDEAGNPVPDGVVGEIHVGGAGLATGYIGRDDLTAQRFIADPFAGPSAGGGTGSARLYRSGDLAVRRRDGVLDFRGRADRQVQLRGFRIELGEVEAAALELEEVTFAHARVLRHGDGDERLVVDLVGPDPATADPVALRRAIATILPAQMAPSAVSVLAEVPLTVNGKLDEDALPEPALPSTGGRAPNGPLEALICAEFASVLGLDSCSPEDSFFDLGGHSLLAVSLVARLQAATGRKLRVGTLLGAPTPALLAAHLHGDGTVADDAELKVVLPLRVPAGQDTGEPPAGHRGTVFCLHPAGGLSWCYAGLPKHLPADIPVWGLQARGVLDPHAQPASLADMATDYVDEMLAIDPVGPYHLVGWSLGGMVAHVAAVRLQQLGHRVGVVALLDAYPSEAETGVDEPPLLDALSAVLAMAGLEDDELDGRPETVGTLTEVLAERSSPMAGLEPSVLGALVRTYRNTAKVLREYRHDPYDGDVLFFHATRAGIGPDHDPHEWDRFISGDLRVIDVDCTHREMTRPGPLEHIASVLRAGL